MHAENSSFQLLTPACFAGVPTAAFIDGITDSFPGVLALTTGGNVAAHGVYYGGCSDCNIVTPDTMPCGVGAVGL